MVEKPSRISQLSTLENPKSQKQEVVSVLGQFWSRSNHLGCTQREKKKGGQVKGGVGEWESHPKGALGGGKITHLLELERGLGKRRWEGATNKRGAPKEGREGSRG